MDSPGRTFSYRALVIGVAAMVAMGLWIHFHEVLVPQPNILAENSPPASAVGVFAFWSAAASVCLSGGRT